MQLLPLSHGFSRYLIGVQYMGTRFSGWQSNASQLPPPPSIEMTLQTACQNFLGTQNSFQNFLGSSRTDAGVHAIRNTFQIDLPNRKNHQPYKEHELCYALNHQLQSQEVVVTDARRMTSEFNVRKHSIQRTYMYRIFHRASETDRRSYGYSNLFHRDSAWFLHQTLDIQAMRDACPHLLGQHDFSSFRNARCQANTPYRNVTSILIDEEPLFRNNFRSQLLLDGYRLVTITITANAFLYRMVRNIVAVLVQIGLKRRPPSDIKVILEARDRNFIYQVSPAPPQGLFLVNVEHDLQYQIEDRDEPKS